MRLIYHSVERGSCPNFSTEVSPKAVGSPSTWELCITFFLYTVLSQKTDKWKQKKKKHGKFRELTHKRGKKNELHLSRRAATSHACAHNASTHIIHTALGQRNRECECHLGLRVWTTDRRSLWRQQQQVIKPKRHTHTSDTEKKMSSPFPSKFCRFMRKGWDDQSSRSVVNVVHILRSNFWPFFCLIWRPFHIVRAVT